MVRGGSRGSCWGPPGARDGPASWAPGLHRRGPAGRRWPRAPARPWTQELLLGGNLRLCVWFAGPRALRRRACPVPESPTAVARARDVTSVLGFSTAGAQPSASLGRACLDGRKPGRAGATGRSSVRATTWGTGLCRPQRSGVTATRARQGTLDFPAHPSVGHGDTAARAVLPPPPGLGSREHPRGSIPAADVAAKHRKAPDSPICVLPPERENSLRRLPFPGRRAPTLTGSRGLFSQADSDRTESRSACEVPRGTSQQLRQEARPGAQGGPPRPGPRRAQEPGRARPQRSRLPQDGHPHGAGGQRPPRREGDASHSHDRSGQRGGNGQPAGHRRLLPRGAGPRRRPARGGPGPARRRRTEDADCWGLRRLALLSV